jgi:putative ABC transport system substrate-binding protein
MRRGVACCVGVLLGVLVLPFLSDAQRPTPVPQIGLLTPQPHPAREQAFRGELRRLGYTEGQTIVIHSRSADGNFERLPGLAAELVGLNVDVLVTVVTQATVAARTVTDSVPIVMVAVSDPVGAGLVASLGRPGGNVTGTSAVAGVLVAKQLELLHEIVPRASQVTALWNPANLVFQQQQLTEAKAAAARLKIQLRMVEARSPDELDRAFVTIGRQRTQALLVMADPMLSSQAARIGAAAIKQRLPSVSSGRDYADGGLLVSYGPNFIDAYVRAAAYVDRILRGARPADLPVEQGTKFELVVNARTARALGLTIPQPVILRADHVLE